MSSPDPDAAPASHRRVRPLAAAAVVTGLAVAVPAWFAVRSLWPVSSHPVPVAVPVSTATVQRTDLSARQTVPGTLGYQGTFSVTDELGAGIITWLPRPGQTVRRGQVLFRVSGQAVRLLYGRVPAWRAFSPGITPGPDVRELQQNLAALGYQVTADGSFGWVTEAAAQRWQQAHGMPAAGGIPLGSVVFLPGPVRVTAAAIPLGAPAGLGAAVLSATSRTPSVSVSLTVGGPAAQPGDRVLVTMPDGTTTVGGKVTSVGRVATVPSTAQGAGGGQAAAIPVTITIGSQIPAGLDQAPVQVTITEQEHRNVLAVPVTALLALPGGGYAVRSTAPPRRLIPVTTGLFDDASGLVEVAGRGLGAGMTVEVAQG